MLFRLLRSPLLTSVALCALMVFTPEGAQAHGGDERPLTQIPPAPRGTDGAKAEDLLRELATRPAAAQRVVTEPVEHARRALARAHGARAAGDQAHAHQLHGLALEWAETARDLLRAAEAEKTMQEAAQQAREVTTKLERARVLLAETQARLARATTELDRVEAAAREASQAAAASEAARIEASRKGNAKAGNTGKTGDPEGATKQGATGKGTSKPAAKGGGR